MRSSLPVEHRTSSTPPGSLSSPGAPPGAHRLLFDHRPVLTQLNACTHSRRPVTCNCSIAVATAILHFQPTGGTRASGGVRRAWRAYQLRRHARQARREQETGHQRRARPSIVPTGRLGRPRPSMSRRRLGRRRWAAAGVQACGSSVLLPQPAIPVGVPSVHPAPARPSRGGWHNALMTGLCLALANLKPGTGKTTSAVWLAHVFAQAGNGVLLVDADPSGSALEWSDLAAMDPRIAPRQAFPFRIVALPSRQLHRRLPAIARDDDVVIIDTPQIEDHAAIARSAPRYADEIVIPCAPPRRWTWTASLPRSTGAAFRRSWSGSPSPATPPRSLPPSAFRPPRGPRPRRQSRPGPRPSVESPRGRRRQP